MTPADSLVVSLPLPAEQNGLLTLRENKPN